jgi:hypothetical protein
MKKLSLIALSMSMYTTSLAANCHSEAAEVKHESSDINYQKRQVASIEQQKKYGLSIKII